MASLVYTSALAQLMRGAIDFEHDEFRVMLCTSRYRPSKKHSVLSDVVGCEVVGVGYGSGGAVASVEVVPANNGVAVSLGGAAWLASTLTAHYGVYYQKLGGELIAVIDFGSNVVSHDTTFGLSESTLKI